ncbi:MAG: LysR family transcriptional regulator [Gammaproteobacteria bacterium HGW-Gammaproteobacteria-14]|nr:MAG: LysR family transcriptional regulator [Gammaproteobacteria bacterium HGW-Gammaproteobacteria-14]
MDLKVSLEQWRALLAVVDAGGYAPAAELLDKSQSAVSYAIQKLETALAVRVFRLEGRRAVLTEAGEILYRRAQALVEEASRLEISANDLSRGVEAQLYLAVDAIYPVGGLLECLDRFAAEFPETRVELLETVLSGTDEALLQHQVDIAITPRVPPGFIGDSLVRVRFIAVAHPDHPLHQLGRPLAFQDLRRHRQLVVRDSGSRKMDAGWLGAEQRWTVSHLSTSIRAAAMGLGFAWYPEEKIRDELERGLLKPLPMVEGQERFAELYLVYAEADYAGPACRRLGEIFRQRVA